VRLVSLPLSFVLRARGVGSHSAAFALVVDEASAVDVAVGVDEGRLTVPLAVAPAAVVDRAVLEQAPSSAVHLVLPPVALVQGAAAESESASAAALAAGVELATVDRAVWVLSPPAKNGKSRGFS